MSKSLKKVLKKIVSKDLNEKLAVADAKLGNSIKVNCFYHINNLINFSK